MAPKKTTGKKRKADPAPEQADAANQGAGVDGAFVHASCVAGNSVPRSLQCWLRLAQYCRATQALCKQQFVAMCHSATMWEYDTDIRWSERS